MSEETKQPVPEQEETAGQETPKTEPAAEQETAGKSEKPEKEGKGKKKKDKEKEKVYKMIDTNRIRYFAPADYSKDSELDILIKEIINKTASYEILEKRFISNHSEANSFIKPC